jgi:hypothetical protein
METIPQELLDTILSARLTCRAFHRSKALIEQFIALVSETPLIRNEYAIPALEHLSASPYAATLIMLSLSGITLYPRPNSSLWGNEFIEYLANLLSHFPSVKHLRFYHVTPASLKHVSRTKYIKDMHNSPFDETCITHGEPQFSNYHAFSSILAAFRRAKINLVTLTTPLLGNRAAYCAIQPYGTHWPLTLTRLSINLTDVHLVAMLDQWIFALQNLETLDIALSHAPGIRFGAPQRLVDHPAAGEEEVRKLPKVKHFTLTADNWHAFPSSAILSMIKVFPNLTSLGLAYIMLRRGTWSGVLGSLQPLGLERVWLLDPGYAYVTDDADAVRVWGYIGSRWYVGPHMEWNVKDVARDGRLVHTGAFYWSGVHRRRYEFEYPGFEVFEEGGERRLEEWRGELDGGKKVE